MNNGSQHHQRTVDTAVTPDRASAHEILRTSRRAAKRQVLVGVTGLVLEEIKHRFADGRAFTSNELVPIIAEHFPDKRVELKDVQKALWHLCHGAPPAIYRSGGPRGQSFALHTDENRLLNGPRREQRSVRAIVDEILDSLNELAQRCERAEKIEAKLKELGARFD